MKTIFSLLLACCICLSLFAQTVTKTYVETFDGNSQKFGWRKAKGYEIKDEAYQVTSVTKGSTYQEMDFTSDFTYEQGQDWTLELSMKKIAGYGVTDQWGIVISEYSKQPDLNIWMDKDGAYGSWGHMEFKVKKDFNDMKLVKTGDSIAIYFNGKLMGGGSIAKRPSGHFVFSQSEKPGLIVQYDNIKFEITKKAPAPVAVVAEEEYEEEYDEYGDVIEKPKGFTDCKSYNIITEPGHTDCLKKLDAIGLTYLYHPLWKQSQNKTATTTIYEIATENTIKVGDDYKQTPAEFNKSLPLFDKYHYVHFKHSVSRGTEKSFEAEIAEIKGWGHDPKEFDFTNNAGSKGKLITVNYLHDGMGIWMYQMYAVIQTKDGFLYSMMDFGCFPQGDISSGVKPEDEAAFRQWALAYFSGLVAK